MTIRVRKKTYNPKGTKEGKPLPTKKETLKLQDLILQAGGNVSKGKSEVPQTRFMMAKDV